MNYFDIKNILRYKFLVKYKVGYLGIRALMRSKTDSIWDKV